ncbi:uncharacterized protein LOC128883234 [Hylaeus volcanicus]|uniref:uncharacterized protein LOC128883234 n=1 Tax=Hylaeus volcanicus TaxID=313075 RepID=UPI0023B7FD62|nr:uncharacterized protein LOC128883234 [Hylaeus volcanicus]XP_053991353.1 uncharacterized protein LOC128883234 [Hylaeus volcanicus]
MKTTPYTLLQGTKMSLPNTMSKECQEKKNQKGVNGESGCTSLRVICNQNNEYFSDTGNRDGRRLFRNIRKRADIKKGVLDRLAEIKTQGTVWACCCSHEYVFDDLQAAYHEGYFDPSILTLVTAYSEVLYCKAFEKHTLFLFKFGCVVAWNLTLENRVKVLNLLRHFQKKPYQRKYEEDEMNFALDDKQGIRQDTIHIVTDDMFEKLGYSYAFAQCVKLAYFESNVDETIERTRAIPESLAVTGKVNSTRKDISRRIGELFTSRFYINLHTDILDTPDIFWDFDEYAHHYSSCRRYLEIPKRVEILNQRLDIIKDLYDMLNDELTIQHGHRLEWIVIYLICIEVAIEIIWKIIIKDILKLV